MSKEQKRKDAIKFVRSVDESSFREPIEMESTHFCTISATVNTAVETGHTFITKDADQPGKKSGMSHSEASALVHKARHAGLTAIAVFAADDLATANHTGMHSIKYHVMFSGDNTKEALDAARESAKIPADASRESELADAQYVVGAGRY